jgi:hypothetical protein
MTSFNARAPYAIAGLGSAELTAAAPATLATVRFMNCRRFMFLILPSRFVLEHL